MNDAILIITKLGAHTGIEKTRIQLKFELQESHSSGVTFI